MPPLVTFVSLAATVTLVCGDSSVTSKVQPADTRGLRALAPLDEERTLPGEASVNVWSWFWDKYRRLQHYKTLEAIQPKTLKKMKPLNWKKVWRFVTSRATFEEQVTLVTHAMDYYGADVFTEALLKERTIHRDAKETVNVLLFLQRESFLARGQDTPADVVQRLKIPHDEKVLADPFMEIVEDYIETFNVAFQRSETLLSALTAIGEVNLVESVALAKATKHLRERGELLENQLLAQWKSEELHPRELLDRFEMEKNLEEETLDEETVASLGGTVMVYIDHYNANAKDEDKFSVSQWFATKHGNERVESD
ncbi:hypothetical protein PsorP6_015865 [Peronosclerospora sorghi]|uniref:Uncharacterized protein n=1 Tax=Peronosclerospora sorghi TaxID=230839 RepID=A0ACC0WLW1_9STRA|nr:hypothetical protein PsorP6_015865 [Peronosclerospora sorghi]